jgi:lipid II:glycine glycyltransferase (peptidoglycan interpeptide bridge formation enzyme)
LDLDKDYEELLVAMHSKTRYNIGLAKKKGLKIEERKDLEVFWDLMKRTGERDNFRLHNKKHYEEVLGSNLTSQVIIYFENKPIATGVFIIFGQTFTYLYGASDYEYRQFMAPYLIQDFGINKAKKEGFKKYDFFGIAPVKKDENEEWIYDDKHQYAGVTRFKLGFGGEYVSLVGTYEIVINKVLYLFVSLVKKIRKIIKL